MKDDQELAVMIVLSGNVFILSLCSFLRVGFGIEIGIEAVVGALLSELNSPLKLTIMTCWNAETTVQFVRYLNDDPFDFQVKIMNGSDVIPNIFEQHQEALIVDLNCGNAVNIFAKINRHMFNSYKIIIFDSNFMIKPYRNYSSYKTSRNIDWIMQQIFRDSPILTMSQIFYINNDFETNTFSIKQVYRPGLNEPLILEEFAFYDGERFVRATAMTPVLRRKDLLGYQLKSSMVIMNNDSLNHLDDYRDIHIDAISKLCYQLTNHLVRFVNGTVKYSVVPTWGYKNQTTEKWNGMVGDLLTNEADIGATGLFFTPDRVSMLEYVTRTTDSSLGFVFRSPKLSYTNNIYLLPFDLLLWICLLLLVFVIAVSLGVVVFLELKTFSNGDHKCRPGDVVMIIFGAVCQQGTVVTPNSVTGRIIVAIAFTILMFLYASYSANIVALLQSPSNQIKTLQDLYESKLDVSVEDNVYNKYYFPRETESLRKKFYDEKVVDKDGEPKFIALEDGMKKVREGQFAFHTLYPSAYKVISETFLDIEKCGLQEINFFQMKLSPWYVIQKNSSYKEILKIGMMRINEHGLQQREHLRLFMTKPKCLGGGGNFESANLGDTGPAILILLRGMVMALIVLICELILSFWSVIQKNILIILTKVSNY